MLRTVLASLGLLTALCHTAVAAETEYAKPVAKIDLADGDTLVFLGDSITHQCLYTQYVEDYFYTRYPHQRIRFHNSGVGGDRNADALHRFEADVAAYKPKYVTVLLGMNDGSYRPFHQETFDTYEKDMVTLIEQIKAIGATPVLMTPTIYDARAARLRKRGDDYRNTYYNATLAYFGARIREMAMVQGLGFVDMYSPLNSITLEQRKTDPTFTLVADAVHPGPDGQVVMAAAILEDMHANRQVSQVHVTIDDKGYAKANVSGGKLQGVENDTTSVRFTFQAESLPWVLPEEAALGYKLTKAGHRLSREVLRVTGLQPGRYRLNIEGATVGTYSSVQLARGIELQANPKTPQHQQALKVALLNKSRNDEAYRPIRNLWRDKKIQRRAEAQAKADPENEKLAKRLQDINAKLENFEAGQATLLQKAKEFEDQIYEANKPQMLEYELTRVQRKDVRKQKAGEKAAAQ